MAYTTKRKIRRKCPHCAKYINLTVEDNHSAVEIREVKGLGKSIKYEE